VEANRHAHTCSPVGQGRFARRSVKLLLQIETAPHPSRAEP